MRDIFSKAKRSEVMSRIRSRGNKGTELALAQIFRRHGITGWRRNQPLFGRPDFVFRSSRTAVFVDGCFWHACPRHATWPKGNRRFWRQKFARNTARDRLVTVGKAYTGLTDAEIAPAPARNAPQIRAKIPMTLASVGRRPFMSHPTTASARVRRFPVVKVEL